MVVTVSVAYRPVSDEENAACRVAIVVDGETFVSRRLLSEVEAHDHAVELARVLRARVDRKEPTP